MVFGLILRIEASEVLVRRSSMTLLIFTLASSGQQAITLVSTATEIGTTMFLIQRSFLRSTPSGLQDTLRMIRVITMLAVRLILRILVVHGSTVLKVR